MAVTSGEHHPAPLGLPPVNADGEERWRASVIGRNLGDDRHVVTESEIGDSQFYVAPPRRVAAEIGYRF